MSKNLVIFGCGDIAELAHYYFSSYTDYTVVAFTVDAVYLKNNKFCGLDVVPFEEIESLFPTSSADMFIALSYSKLNQLRAQKYNEAKAKGYKLASYVSPHATVLNDGQIGDNCFILEDNTIQPFVTIGNNVTLWSGNHIGHHSVIKDNNFISSHVVVSGGVTVNESCFIGVNATLRDHISIGKNNIIGAGAVIMTDTDDAAVYIADKTDPKKITSDKIRNI
jgi:sugar O-acyltransferase (sialic acid O-acetyltransferase NeuD family)